MEDGVVQTIKISDFKARCLAILEEVERTGESLTVLKRGRPIALISPAPKAEHPQLSLFGSVKTVGDIVAPIIPEAEWECLQ